MAVTPFREQLQLIINPLFMQQDDLTTAIPEEYMTDSLAATPDGKEWFKLNREYREQPSCTGEDLRNRKVKTQIGSMNVVITGTPEQCYAVVAAARGISSAPVANGGGDFTHTSARQPAYHYNLPGTTIALAFAEEPDLPVKILRGCKVDSYEVIGAWREFITMRVTFVFYPEVTEASEDFVIPACTDFDALDMEDSQLLLDAVDISADMFDASATYGNRVRRGQAAYTNNSKNPTRLIREARRDESMDFTLTKNVGDPLHDELEAAQELDHAVVFRAGAATRHLTHNYSKARLSFANDGPEFSGDGNPFVMRVRATPLAVNGVTSIVTSRNKTADQYLPPVPPPAP